MPNFDDEPNLSKPKQTGTLPPMKSIDALEIEITNTRLGDRSKHMPDLPIKSARWWIDMQERPNRTERPIQVGTKNGTRWNTPYTDRLIQTYRAFIKLSHEDQQLIISCHEDGVYWRGDDIETFYRAEHSVYNETMKMQDMGVEAYKRKVRPSIKAALKGISKTDVEQPAEEKQPEPLPDVLQAGQTELEQQTKLYGSDK